MEGLVFNLDHRLELEDVFEQEVDQVDCRLVLDFFVGLVNFADSFLVCIFSIFEENLLYLLLWLNVVFLHQLLFAE